MIYCIDIDGVIANTHRNDYLKSTPNQAVIDKIKRLYDEGNIIKIFTARGSHSGIKWQEFTKKQLDSWQVKYHELIMGKPHADIFVDDRSITGEDLLSDYK